MGETENTRAFAVDVTEQVLTHRQREEQRQLLQQVFEQAPMGVYVVRMPNYVLDVVNLPMAQLLGRPVEQLHGRSFFEAVPALASQGVPALLAGCGARRRRCTCASNPSA